MAHKINRKINEIIIHCTDTEHDSEVTIEDLKKWHIEERGFKYIGYHFFIDLSGNVTVCRPLSVPGAHCKKHNSNSIGIAYAGGRKNGDYSDTRNANQKEALNRLIALLVHVFPIDKISGHKDYANKECPCFDAKEEYSHIISQNHVTD